MSDPRVTKELLDAVVLTRHCLVAAFPNDPHPVYVSPHTNGDQMVVAIDHAFFLRPTRVRLPSPCSPDVTVTKWVLGSLDERQPDSPDWIEFTEPLILADAIARVAEYIVVQRVESVIEAHELARVNQEELVS
jgi:hypothetical protein